MKNWTWKQWTAIGIIAAIIVAAVVLHLVQPTVSYAFLEISALFTFALGIVTGWLIWKKNEQPNK